MLARGKHRHDYGSDPRPPVCKNPTRFAYDSTTCGTCGRLLAEHPEQPVPVTGDVDAKSWAVLLRYGGLHDSFGGYRYAPWRESGERRTWDEGTDIIMDHMANCRVDLGKSSTPQPEDLSRFAGTFAPPEEFQAIGGLLTCVCGGLEREHVVIHEITFGEFLWLVLKEGEEAND